MSEAKRLRRPAEGGYARGDETRLRIIDAAIELFGERGFAAASTRDIASRAGVNAPALQYYFENKEGVYRACAEHIAEVVWTPFEPVVDRASDALANATDAAPLIDAFIAIQETMADKVFFSPATPSQRLFIVREQTGQEPPIASQVLQERLREPLNRVCAKLIARIGGTAVDDPLTLIRTISLHGQLVIFHTSPRSTL
ncbi:MAG TPA: CerR family C-terminal domain-containing protein, partial [Trinickia sp.]|nr:CerR family C-terminal domain-containing protein [Trinickia sp.]